MNDFDLRKYLQNNRLLQEDTGFHRNTTTGIHSRRIYEAKYDISKGDPLLDPAYGEPVDMGEDEEIISVKSKPTTFDDLADAEGAADYYGVEVRDLGGNVFEFTGTREKLELFLEPELKDLDRSRYSNESGINEESYPEGEEPEGTYSLQLDWMEDITDADYHAEIYGLTAKAVGKSRNGGDIVEFVGPKDGLESLVKTDMCEKLLNLIKPVN